MTRSAAELYPHLLEPFTIRGKRFRNHIAMAPFVSCLTSPDGAATAETVKFYEEASKTGVAYITIGDTQVDHVHGASFAGELNVTSDLYNGSLYSIADAIHKHGTLASIELNHGGRGANKNMISAPAFAPSDLPLPGGAPVKPMNEGDMQFVRDRFVNCAKRCEAAGFDMIMVHSAHNCLLGQFLSPATNFREDEYGGSLENRMRFPLSVLKAVREALNPTTVMEVRVSGDEMNPKGLHFQESLEFCKQAERYADIVHFSRGNIFEHDYSRWVMPNYMMRPGYNLEFSRPAKKVLQKPVAVVGGFESLEQAEKVVANGDADIVAMAHALICDPDLINKTLAGHPEKVRPCLRCQEGCGSHAAVGYPIRCAVNPLCGRELQYANPQPATSHKKVVVVGAGPAGMVATQVLAKRGHSVVLMDKKDHLGGALDDAGALPIKHNIAEYESWEAAQTTECAQKYGIKVELGCEATKDLVLAENPDEVIVATGAAPIRPHIPGIDGPNVHMAAEVDHKLVPIGKRVLVVGAGLTGLESAIQLGMDGHDVTVVDMIALEKFGAKNPVNYQSHILPYLRRYQVKLVGGCKVSCFTESGAVVASTDGIVHTIDADTVVISMGSRPNSGLYQELSEELPLNVHCIGDARGVANIREATRSAFDLAMTI